MGALAWGLLLSGCSTRVDQPHVAGDHTGRLADLSAPADSVREASERALESHGFPLDGDLSTEVHVVTGYRPATDSLADGRRLRAEARVLPIGPDRARLWLLLVEAPTPDPDAAPPGRHLPEVAVPPSDPAYGPLLEAIANQSR